MLKNIKGMSLIEVLVAAGLAAIVSLGIATMMQNSFKEQKKIVLLATVKELKARQENLIRDPNAWSKNLNLVGTLNSNALFVGLKNNCVTAFPCNTTAAPASSPSGVGCVGCAETYANLLRLAAMGVAKLVPQLTDF